MKKKIITTLIFISLILLSTSCGYNNKEKQYINELKKQAQENAISYIQEKYSFTPKIISSTIEKLNSPASFKAEPSGNIIFKCTYNNQEFIIYISGKEKTTEGYDNYQMSKIIEDVTNYINNLTKITPEKISIKYGKSPNNNNTNGLIKEYYQNNLIDIINTNNFKITAQYININNFTDIKNNSLFTNITQADLKFINYRDKKSYQRDKNDYNSSSSFNEQKIVENSTNIKSAYLNTYGKEKFYQFD